MSSIKFCIFLNDDRIRPGRERCAGKDANRFACFDHACKTSARRHFANNFEGDRNRFHIHRADSKAIHRRHVCGRLGAAGVDVLDNNPAKGSIDRDHLCPNGDEVLKDFLPRFIYRYHIAS